MTNSPSGAWPFHAIKVIASRAVLTGVAATFLIISGCATRPGGDPRDPFEPFNRGVTKFNDAVDEAILKPVATGYVNVLPQPVRTGVRNFFLNLTDVWSFVNHTLQGNAQYAGDSLTRFNMNTLFGLGGVLDVASEFEIERRREDFGQTLGRYGVASGPYVVLPLLGPSTLRDTAVLPIETKGNLLSYVNDVPTRNALVGLRVVDTRANLLRTTSMLEGAALDKYTFTRDAYLQVRRAEVDESRLRKERDREDRKDDGQLPAADPRKDDGKLPPS